MGDTTNMKFFVLACLVAAAYAEAEPKAEAEADPALLYSTYGYHYPSVYSGLHHPYVYGSYYRPYGGYHYLGKRSAEAEPKAEAEADPALLFSTPTSMAPTTDPMVDITILARDLPKLSLLLRLLLILRLIPTFSTAMAIPTPMVMPVFITPMPTAPIITDLMDMPTGDKRLSESSQKKKYKRKPSTLFVEQLLHYTPEWTNIHQLHPLFLNL